MAVEGADEPVDGEIYHLKNVQAVLVFAALWTVLYLGLPSLRSVWVAIKFCFRASISAGVALPLALIVIDENLRRSALEFSQTYARESLPQLF
jgi:hypothetical protein